MSFGKIKFANGSTALFELSEEYRGPVGACDIAGNIERSFDEIMCIAENASNNAHACLMRIPHSIRPNEYEISFSISINAEAGAFFAKAGTEGIFQVTLRWNELEGRPSP
jgi:hypothetical protein